FQYAHTGSVDYGFVAQSQLTAIKATPDQFYTLAADSYPPILQDGIVISDSSIAIDFSNYLRSSAGQQYFSNAGYLAIE
ncbi:MAG: substrate-binding domain-containing protein, partial [Psychrobacter alimentarius]